jgi:group II intron reverse transcriptase/maturase
MKDIARKQKDLALKATQRPESRIGGLFPLVCEEEWLIQAMRKIIHNKGAETAGVDGVIKAKYYDSETQSLNEAARTRIREISLSLKDMSYKPQPVRRTYIPKPNGRLRPIGVPTIDDRIVQEAIRMVLEPIYESDFLFCSHGFRPNRCTMDAIKVCYQRICPSQKYYWIIEGDIKGCFDNIDHKILLKLLRKRIADNRLVSMIRRFLNAGYTEDGSIYKPNVGTPQGGILSPLLANIYLHEMDKWWAEEYHPPQRIRNARRAEGRGNYLLSRYADDFIILSNDIRKGVEEMRDRLRDFLRQELKLELSSEKTAITHAYDGFDFLGFHIRKYKSRKGVLITPSEKNVQKMKDKMDGFLCRKRFNVEVAGIVLALNPVISGWSNYFRYVNSYQTFLELDWYLKRKFAKWYRGKYKMNFRQGTAKAQRWIRGKETLTLRLFRYTQVERYKWSKRKENPYIEGKVKTMVWVPFTDKIWYGKREGRNVDLIYQCYQRDDGVCQICQRPKTNLIAHHIIPISEIGKEADTLDNMITICKDCERKHFKELHQEIRTPEGVIQLGGSRVRCKVASTVSM